MKFVIDKDIPFVQGVFEPFAEVVYLPCDAIDKTCVRDADALVIRTRTVCGRALLESSKVRFIGTATIGTDHIDKPYCQSHGIVTASAPGCNARAVLQWVSAALVNILKIRGCTPPEVTLGVVGVGHVGSLVAQYAESWGFRVLRNDPPREAAEPNAGFVSLESLLRGSDIVTLHTPYVRDGLYPTIGLLGGDGLSLLGHEAVVMNCARGGILDERAVTKLGLDAAVDTWCGEPAISAEMLARAIISTPHIAGYSLQGKARGTEMIVDAASKCFGLPFEYQNRYPSTPRAIDWQELTRTIPAHYDILAESRRLKQSPSEFENMRNGYDYRNEYF